MVAILSFLAVAAVSILIQRTATVALSLTGLSRDIARFQSMSAFTGTGFTTDEAEYIVQQPVRRTIIQLLMMARSFGIIGATSSLVVSFARTSSATQGLRQVAWLAVGLVVLAIFGTSRWVDARLSPVIRWALRRWSDLEVRDYSELLGIRRGYGVLEILVHPESWLADRTLSELELPEEGVTVLGIHRNDGSYVGAPHGRSRVQANDKLILYGRSEHLSTLGDRPSGWYGDQEREAAQKEQMRIVTEQDGQERSRTMRP